MRKLAIIAALVLAPIAAHADDDFTVKLTGPELDYIVGVMRSTPLVYDQWFPIVQKMNTQVQAQRQARENAPKPPDPAEVAKLPLTPPAPKR